MFHRLEFMTDPSDQQKFREVKSVVDRFAS